MKKDSAGFNRFKLLIWPGLMGIGLWALFLFNQWAFVNHHLVMSDARWSYGMGFALIAGFMLGGLTRLGPAVPVLVWRTLTLIMASLMAWVEVSLHHYPSGYAGILVASAVLGISVLCLFARLLPPGRLKVLWLSESIRLDPSVSHGNGTPQE